MTLKSGLTADIIRSRYLSAIPNVTSVLENEDIEFFIQSAESFIEAQFHTLLVSGRVITDDSIFSGAYDKMDEPYDLEPREVQGWFFIQLRYQPILAINSLKLLNPYDNTVIYTADSNQLRLKKQMGGVQIAPFFFNVGMAFAETGGVTPFPFIFGGSHDDRLLNTLPNCFQIDYQVGWETVDKIPTEIVDLIGRKTAMEILVNLSPGANENFASSYSTSVDGVSESVSTGGFERIIDMHKKLLDELIEQCRFRYFPIEMAIL